MPSSKQILGLLCFIFCLNNALCCFRFKRLETDLLSTYIDPAYSVDDIRIQTKFLSHQCFSLFCRPDRECIRNQYHRIDVEWNPPKNLPKFYIVTAETISGNQSVQMNVPSSEKSVSMNLLLEPEKRYRVTIGTIYSGVQNEIKEAYFHVEMYSLCEVVRFYSLVSFGIFVLILIFAIVYVVRNIDKFVIEIGPTRTTQPQNNNNNNNCKLPSQNKDDEEPLKELLVVAEK